MEIGRLQPVPLRDLWKHEAKDFGQWLAENLEILGEKLGISLSLVQREKDAGIFKVDIQAEDENGDNVIIECQLERTDHDHLGKLITYNKALDAKKAIWICKEACPEHIQAVNWLNESTPEGNSFYLVKVEAVRIGDSLAAPLFQVICSPSAEFKQAGKEKGELARRHILRREFWGQLLDKSKAKTKLFSNVSPSTDNWIAAGAGKAGLTYNFTITMDAAHAELYIDKGKGSEEINKKRFKFLYDNKGDIEHTYGGSLNWISTEGRRSTVIHAKVSDCGLRDTEKWDDTQDMMIDAMVRLEKALRPHIAKLEA